jgi:MFS transporter, DHA2 family, multidrug resistance protein
MACRVLGEAPLLLAAAVLGLVTVPSRAGGAPGPERGSRALAGAVALVGTAVTAALLAIEQIARRPLWAAALVVLAVATGAGWTRTHTSRPVLALVRRGQLGWPALALMLNSSVVGLIAFSLPFFISDVMYRGPQLLSTALVFFVAASAVITPLAGLLADRFARCRSRPWAAPLQ